MKLFYLIIAICSITSFQSFGQTFDWVTGNTIETNLDLNTTVLLKMEQTAIGADTVTTDSLRTLVSTLSNTTEWNDKFGGTVTYVGGTGANVSMFEEAVVNFSK